MYRLSYVHNMALPLGRIYRLLQFLVLVATLFGGGAPRRASAQGDFPAPNPPPAVFVFGDSLVDPGNNNFIFTLAKANLLYNGIDFPSGPTGRFCNGRTVADVICDIVGVPYPPPFMDPHTNGTNILKGVNYASGAAGILDATGANFLNRISMNRQITNFQDNTLSQLEAQMGTDSTATFLSLSLVFVIMGSNDFINNYFLDDRSSAAHQYTPEQFNALLVNSFSSQLTTLYNLGFRKFYVSGVGPLGCIPHELAMVGQTTCIDSLNIQVRNYNDLVRSTLQELNAGLPGAMFLLGEAYTIMMDCVNNPQTHGFRVANQACCGDGLYRARVLCQIAAQLCSKRAEYVFWDAYHPTEATNRVLAYGIYNGDSSYVTPMNIMQLLAWPA